MKIFIKTNNKEESAQIIDDIKNIIYKYDHTIKMWSDNMDENKKNIQECDLILAVGGDGTLLSISSLAVTYNKPILGINDGRLGFLTAIEVSHLENLNDFFEHNEKFEVKKHSLLKAKVNKGHWQYCLNDVVIAKNNLSNTISTKVFCNESNIANLVCDSLIVATATGSTAYSLSAGGPILDNDLEALVISPVAVHSLKSTPMVLAKNKKITITFDTSRQQDIYVSFDGNNHKRINEKDTITVNLSNKALYIYSEKNMGQFAKVDKKLKSR